MKDVLAERLAWLKSHPQSNNRRLTVAAIADAAGAFWARVDPCRTDGHWLWVGAINQSGYGVLHVRGVGTFLAHRFARELLVGPVPKGLDVDHVCRVRACCNPDDTEPVTVAENNRRARAAASERIRRGECGNGHSITGSNVYVYGNARVCKACKAAYMKKNFRNNIKIHV